MLEQACMHVQVIDAVSLDAIYKNEFLQDFYTVNEQNSHRKLGYFSLYVCEILKGNRIRLIIRTRKETKRKREKVDRYKDEEINSTRSNEQTPAEPPDSVTYFLNGCNKWVLGFCYSSCPRPSTLTRVD